MTLPTIFDEMARTRDQIFEPFQAQFNKVFDEFFGPRSKSTIKSLVRTSYPKLDAVVAEGQYRVDIAVPGVNPDDLKVEIRPVTESIKTEEGVTQRDTGYRVLRISGRMDHRFQTPQESAFQVRELKRSFFEREELLPKGLEGDPEAKYEHGMLSLIWQLPEKENEPEARQIEIRRA